MKKAKHPAPHLSSGYLPQTRNKAAPALARQTESTGVERWSVKLARLQDAIEEAPVSICPMVLCVS